jgi:hypothetical protein
MTQVLLAVDVVLAILLTALSVAVLRLRGEVRRLIDAAEGLGAAPGESRPARPPVEEGSRRSRQARPLARPAEDEGRSPVEGVVVITELTDASPGPADITRARIASVTLGRPLIKLAAFSYGLRRALDDEHRLRTTLAFRQELRRQRKLRRRSARTTPMQESGL